jgi:hypothetical protein
VIPAAPSPPPAFGTQPEATSKPTRRSTVPTFLGTAMAPTRGPGTTLGGA